jgi:hypothetical protein
MSKSKKSKNLKLKNDLMKKIKTNQIKMKSRYNFLAKKIGLQSGLILSVIILIFLINAFFYYIKTNHLLIPLHYGPSVWQKLLHSLPYDLILIIIGLFVLLNFIIKKFDFSYKKPFIYIVSGFIGFIVIWASLLFSTRFNDLLKAKFQTSDIKAPYIKDFYLNRCGCHNQEQEGNLTETDFKANTCSCPNCLGE